jgi:hypothetical protein
MGDAAALDKAMRLGSKGLDVTDWWLYNVIASARDKTICNRWAEHSFPLGVKIRGYATVTCPKLPADLPPPDPSGLA